MEEEVEHGREKYFQGKWHKGSSHVQGDKSPRAPDFPSMIKD